MPDPPISCLIANRLWNIVKGDYLVQLWTSLRMIGLGTPLDVGG
jgi:hypothetical protein